MAESQVKSREARADFDEDVLEGEKKKTPGKNSQEMKHLTSVSMLGWFKTIKYCKGNYVVLK